MENNKQIQEATIAKSRWEKLKDAVGDPIFGKYRERKPYIYGGLTALGIFAGMNSMEFLIDEAYELINDEIDRINDDPDHREAVLGDLDPTVKVDIEERLDIDLDNVNDPIPPLKEIIKETDFPITEGEDLFSTSQEIFYPVLSGALIGATSYLMGTRRFEGKRPLPKEGLSN